MTRYLIFRLLQLPLVVFVVVSGVFLLLRATGDPVAAMLPAVATDEQREQLAAELKLDQPIVAQYGQFLSDTVRGDFGQSYMYSRPVFDVVMERLPNTLLLAATSMLIALIAALGLGITAALLENHLPDRVITTVSLFLQSMPSFWVGLMLVLVLSVNLKIFPTSGTGTPMHLVLPAMTAAAFVTPQLLMLTRASMLKNLKEEYLAFARAKGMPESRVVIHALKNSLGPVFASVGLQFGILIGAAVITEHIFAWPGIGSLSIAAIESSDMQLVIACVVVLAVGVVLGNLIADVANWVADPKLRSGV